MDLLCKTCGETCKSCPDYEGGPHVHLPGGLPTYGLCHPCEEKCLAVHRPIAADGTWKWIKDCGDAACGYCFAMREALSG